jgi:PAS domain S-box-containing protein
LQHDSSPADELLHLLVDQTKELAIILADANGNIKWWNPGAEHIFERKQNDVHGQSVALVFPPEEIKGGFAEHEIAVARAAGAAEDDRWLARQDGSRFWATGVMVALRNGDGDVVGFGKILRNRTDIREQIDTLRNQVAALDSSAHRKDEFLTTLSHELRNPLTPLAYAVELIRRTTTVTPELESHLSVIDRQIEVLRRLVDDLMDLSRISAGKVELKREEIALHEVIGRAIESVAPTLRERHHELDVLFPDTPIMVRVDPARIQQVFVNLLNNAVKYTPDGGRINIQGTTEGSAAVVRVQDSGIGITHDMLPRIFELFTQADSSREHRDGGLGVGLALVKNLVTLHRGSVQVRSEGEGKGSEFIVRLPLVTPPVPDHP